MYRRNTEKEKHIMVLSVSASQGEFLIPCSQLQMLETGCCALKQIKIPVEALFLLSYVMWHILTS